MRSMTKWVTSEKKLDFGISSLERTSTASKPTFIFPRRSLVDISKDASMEAPFNLRTRARIDKQPIVLVEHTKDKN